MAAARALYPSAQGAGQQFLSGPHQQLAGGMGMGTSSALPGWPTSASGSLQPSHPQPGQSQGGWPATY
jgi:hypothetical protein